MRSNPDKARELPDDEDIPDAMRQQIETIMRRSDLRYQAAESMPTGRPQRGTPSRSLIRFRIFGTAAA